MQHFDKGSIPLFLFVATLATIAYLFDDELMIFIRFILEEGHLNNILVLVVCIVVITHVIKVQSKSSALMLKSGYTVFDLVLNLVTYYSVTSTACSLLEGAYLQKFYEIEYFTKFKEIDINVLLGVCALLLWYVLLHAYKMSQEIFFKPSHITATNPQLQQEVL